MFTHLFYSLAGPSTRANGPTIVPLRGTGGCGTGGAAARRARHAARHVPHHAARHEPRAARHGVCVVGHGVGATGDMGFLGLPARSSPPVLGVTTRAVLRGGDGLIAGSRAFQCGGSISWDVAYPVGYVPAPGRYQVLATGWSRADDVGGAGRLCGGAEEGVAAG